MRRACDPPRNAHRGRRLAPSPTKTRRGIRGRRSRGPAGPRRRRGLWRLAVPVERDPVDPREVGRVPGAPDHVRNIDDAAILEQGTPVPNAGHPRQVLDAERGEVLWLYADEGRCGGKRLGRTARPIGVRVVRMCLPMTRNSMGRTRRAANVPGRTGMLPVSGPPWRPCAPRASAPARSRLPSCPFPPAGRRRRELAGVAVGRRVKLHDVRIKLGCEVRHARPLIAAHCHDDVPGADAAPVGCVHEVVGPLAAHPLDPSRRAAPAAGTRARNPRGNRPSHPCSGTTPAGPETSSRPARRTGRA